MKDTEIGQIIKVTVQDMKTIISQAMINIMKKDTTGLNQDHLLRIPKMKKNNMIMIQRSN